MSFIEDALTPAGTNAAASQSQRNAQFAKSVQALLPQMQELLAMQSKKGLEYETKRQNVLDGLINALSPGAARAAAEKKKTAAFTDYGKASSLAGMNAKASGLGAGFQAGQQANLAGQAARTASEIDADMLDPVKIAERAGTLLAAIEQGQKMPALSDLAQMANISYGQPQVQVQQGFGSILGTALGGYLGGGSGTSSGNTTASYPYPTNTGGIVETPSQQIASLKFPSYTSYSLNNRLW
jgi:hypothetical protein